MIAPYHLAQETPGAVIDAPSVQAAMAAAAPRCKP